MTAERLRAEAVLLVVACYMLFDHGFQIVRLPPGSAFGVPVGELLVVLFGAMLVRDLRHTSGFAMMVPATALIIWWGQGFTQLAIGLERHGMWALRDGSQLIDSLFLWVGFVVAASPGFLARFPRRLGVLLTVALVYSLGYPVRESLAAYSPTVTAPAGYVSPVLFTYSAATVLIYTAAVRYLIEQKGPLGIPPLVAASLILVYGVLFYQMRSTYLQLAAIIIFLTVMRPAVTGRLVAGLAAGLVLLALLLAAGVEVTGRLGAKFSFDFLLNHVSAIWGRGEGEAVEAAAGGVGQRLAWWGKILADLAADPASLLFGLGYGVALTDFRGLTDALTREPHNSLMSVLGRNGAVGFTAYVALQIMLFATWWRTYHAVSRAGDLAWRNTLLVVMVLFASVWAFSIGEDAFEKPFVAIPYYFLWGVILRLGYETGALPLRTAPVAWRDSARPASLA